MTSGGQLEPAPGALDSEKVEAVPNYIEATQRVSDWFDDQARKVGIISRMAQEFDLALRGAGGESHKETMAELLAQAIADSEASLELVDVYSSLYGQDLEAVLGEDRLVAILDNAHGQREE